MSFPSGIEIGVGVVLLTFQCKRNQYHEIPKEWIWTPEQLGSFMTSSKMKSSWHIPPCCDINKRSFTFTFSQTCYPKAGGCYSESGIKMCAFNYLIGSVALPHSIHPIIILLTTSTQLQLYDPNLIDYCLWRDSLRAYRLAE